MHSTLIKRFAVLALLMALPVVASAQTSRVEGMAIQGDYIKDYTGIYTYLSGVTGVGNLVYGELGQTGPFDRAVGAVLGNLWDGRYGTWAIHMREVTPQLGQGDNSSSPAPGFGGSDPNFNSNESFDIQWGKKFGTTSLGLRLNRSYVKADGDLGYFSGTFGPLTSLEYDVFSAGTNTTFANLDRNIMGFGIGAGFEMNKNTNAEIALLWQNRTYKQSDSTGAIKNEDDGPTTYQLAARAMWQWQPNVMVMPVFKYYSYDLSTKSAGGAKNDNSLKGWQVGVAGNWSLGTNDLFVLGGTFAQNKLDEEADVLALGSIGGVTILPSGNGTVTETIAPQVFAALETHVNNWLTLRFGANKGAFQTIKAEDRGIKKTAKVQFSPFSMSLGAGMKVGTLMLDAVLNNRFPQNMPYLVSGAVTSPLFTKVTATYPF
jgi:hypothetical protein